MGRLVLGSLGRPLPRGSSVVVRRGSSRGGGVSSCSSAGPHVLVRCFQPRVGRSDGRPGCVGPLVRGRGASLHQPQGAVGGGEGSFQAPGNSEGMCGGGIFKQHHGGGVS